MPYQKGNKLWKRREKHGRDAHFDDYVELMEKCAEYFEWAEANPLEELKVFQHSGEIIKGKIPKLRALSKKGLCVHLGITVRCWEDYTRREGFIEACELVENFIYAQKFEGAAAALLEPGIISRELGLAEKSESKQSITINITEKDSEL